MRFASAASASVSCICCIASACTSFARALHLRTSHEILGSSMHTAARSSATERRFRRFSLNDLKTAQLPKFWAVVLDFRADGKLFSSAFQWVRTRNSENQVLQLKFSILCRNRRICVHKMCTPNGTIFTKGFRPRRSVMRGTHSAGFSRWRGAVDEARTSLFAAGRAVQVGGVFSVFSLFVFNFLSMMKFDSSFETETHLKGGIVSFPTTLV